MKDRSFVFLFFWRRLRDNDRKLQEANEEKKRKSKTVAATSAVEALKNPENEASWTSGTIP